MFISSNSGSDRSNGAEAASTATATSLAETLNGIFYAKHDTAAFNVCNIMLVRLVLFTTNCSSTVWYAVRSGVFLLLILPAPGN